MAEIFDFARCLSARAQPDDSDSATLEEFLLNEGLELLAAYRAIPDTKMRMRLKRLVEDVAALSSSTGSKRESPFW